MDMRWFIVFFFMLIFGCQNKDIQDVEVFINIAPPEINLKTPDNAVKSLLAYNNWMLLVQNKANTNIYNQSESKWLNFFEKSPSDSIKSRKHIEFSNTEKKVHQFKPDILSVDIQSDTRAIVKVKSGKYTLGGDYEKTDVINHYVMTHLEGQWIIENIMSTCYFCDGVGKRINYLKSSYRKVFEKCEYCNGDGLEKLF